MSLGPGFISTSPLKNSINKRKLDSAHKYKTTKMLVKIKPYKKRCLPIQQCLYFADEIN